MSASEGRSTTGPALGVHGVSVFYGRRRVLESIDLEVAPGEIFGLIGLNGVGKTTLIKTILDLAQAASGNVSIFGLDSRQPASRKAIAYLPEHLQPNRNLKGREFIDLSLAYFGVRLRDVEEQARSLALDPTALDRRMSTYSKGMVQKAGLLATLLSERPWPLVGSKPARAASIWPLFAPRSANSCWRLVSTSKRGWLAVAISSRPWPSSLTS